MIAAQTYAETSAASGHKVREPVRDSTAETFHASTNDNFAKEASTARKVDRGTEGLGREAGVSGEMVWTADVNTINFYLFKGKRDFSLPFRVS